MPKTPVDMTTQGIAGILPVVSCSASRELVAACASCIECSGRLLANLTGGNLLVHGRRARIGCGGSVSVDNLQTGLQGDTATTIAGCRLSCLCVLIGAEGLVAVHIIAAALAITCCECDGAQEYSQGQSQTQCRHKSLHIEAPFLVV